MAESQSKDSKDLKEEVIMARGRRKVSIDSLDVKIEQQKAVMEKAKLKYEAEKEALAELIKRKRQTRRPLKN